MLLLNDLVDALSWEPTLWGAGRCKRRHQLKLKFQHLLSQYEHSQGQEAAHGKKGKFRQSLLLFSSFHLTLKALQEDRELWWQVSVLTARSGISGQRLGWAESPAGGVGTPALSDYAALRVPNSECAVGLVKHRARGRLVRMSVLERHVAIFFHHLESVFFTEWVLQT